MNIQELSNWEKRKDIRDDETTESDIQVTGSHERILIDPWVVKNSMHVKEAQDASEDNSGKINKSPKYRSKDDFLAIMQPDWENIPGSEIFVSKGFQAITKVDVKNSWVASKASWKDYDLNKLEKNPKTVWITFWQTGLSKTRTQTVPGPYSKYFYVTAADVPKIRKFGTYTAEEVGFGYKPIYILGSGAIYNLFEVFDLY